MKKGQGDGSMSKSSNLSKMSSLNSPRKTSLPLSTHRSAAVTSPRRRNSISPPPNLQINHSTSCDLRVDKKIKLRECRILLISDFSEECDDEIAFEFLMRGCKAKKNIFFTIELLIPDTTARLQWFEYVFKDHFERVQTKLDVDPWKWKDARFLKEEPTSTQFTCGNNILVRLYCTPSAKGERVAANISKNVTTTIERRDFVSDHTRIPQDASLHFILWNSPIPVEIDPEWFAKFENTIVSDANRLLFEDGFLRTYQIGGTGSVNSRPADHFDRICKVLGNAHSRRSMLMFLPEFTRKVRLTRETVQDICGDDIRTAVFSTLVRFMAQRPEIPNNPRLVLRLNKSNAVLCSGWLQAAAGSFPGLGSDERARIRRYADAYVDRMAPSCDKDFRQELLDSVLICVECATQLLGGRRGDYDDESSGDQLYEDPMNSLSALKSHADCVRRAERELHVVRMLTPAYDCVSVAAMLRALSCRSPWEIRSVTLEEDSSSRRNVPAGDNDDDDAATKEKVDVIPERLHQVCRNMEQHLGLSRVDPAVLSYPKFETRNVFVAKTQAESTIDDYTNHIKQTFFPLQCRILLISDFSEECDDEVAFEFLIHSCNCMKHVRFTIDLLFVDAVERIQWFAHVYASHFRRENNFPWTWEEPKSSLAHTPLQFVCGHSKNVRVRLFCAPSDRRKEVAAKIPPEVLRKTRGELPISLDVVPDHCRIPQDEPLNYILWNAPVPVSVKPSWFANFYNERPVKTRSDPSVAPFQDGVLRVFQIGGPGSVNSKPDDHFRRILGALSASEHRTETYMFLKEITRNVRITRVVAKMLPRVIQDAVFRNFVMFMAKRPEFPGGMRLLLRLNRGNADMCTEWLDAASAFADRQICCPLTSSLKRDVMKWSAAYVERYANEDDSEADKTALREAVYTCISCSIQLLCKRGRDPRKLFANPMKSLSKLSNDDECVARARDDLTAISELTPAYDCVSVAAMMQHLGCTEADVQSATFDKSKFSCPGMLVERVYPFVSADKSSEVLKGVYEIPGQTVHVCHMFDDQIEKTFKRRTFAVKRGGSLSPPPPMRGPPNLRLPLSAPSFRRSGRTFEELQEARAESKRKDEEIARMRKELDRLLSMTESGSDSLALPMLEEGE